MKEKKRKQETYITSLCSINKYRSYVFSKHITRPSEIVFDGLEDNFVRSCLHMSRTELKKRKRSK